MDSQIDSDSYLTGKVIGITGASGTLGRALIEELLLNGAKIVAFTTSQTAEFESGIQVVAWQLGAEADLRSHLTEIDILIINHGINVYGDRSISAIHESYEVNTFSALRLMELFFRITSKLSDRSTKELWINTSEAEVNPAFSPLYELSKRTLGDAISLCRLDAPCIVRKLVLGPFKSQLNPAGVMSSRWIAWAIVALAKRGIQNIIVTINPLTYLLFPVKELFQSMYFRAFTKSSKL